MSPSYMYIMSKICPALLPSLTQHNTTKHNTTQHNTTQHNTTKQNSTKQKIDAQGYMCLLLLTKLGGCW